MAWAKSKKSVDKTVDKLCGLDYVALFLYIIH